MDTEPTNDAFVAIDGGNLVVSFGCNGNDRTIVLKFETEAEKELTNMLIGDPNFWAQFLSSLSAAFNRENQEKVIAS